MRPAGAVVKLSKGGFMFAAQAVDGERRMATIRFFHEIYGNVHELQDQGPFPYERGLQEFFEKHLRTLTGVEFLDSEYSTGQRHSRRIDTLGIDEAGRPVVVEYKRHQDQNVINQGLDYLAWLEDHQAEFRELVREKLGDGRVGNIDFRTPRLLCIAGDFLRQDRIAARDSRRRIELLRYRRYGDAYVALEWVYGGEAIEPPPPRPVKRKATDFSIYEPWNKTDDATRTLFRELKTLVESFGSVRTDAFKSEMSFKCVAHANGEPVIAYVHLRVRNGLRVLIRRKHLSDDLLADGFTRACNGGRYREIAIRDGEHIRKAEPLLRAAYDSVGKPQEHGETSRSVAARKAWATRRARRGTEDAESS